MTLIAGELDLQVPDMNFDQLEEFIEITREPHRLLGHCKEEDVYQERNNRLYPWDRRLLEFKGKEFHNYRSSPCFSNITKIIDTLPIKKGELIVLLLHQKNQLDYDFNFHFDNDNPYGFRICFGLDTSKPFLEQARIKKEYQEHALQLRRIENFMVEDERYNLIPLKSNTVFCLNGNEFPHRVPLINSGSRAVLVIRGLLEPLDNLNFLQRIEL